MLHILAWMVSPFFFLLITILVSIQWYLIVALIYISLKLSDIKHHSIHLLAIYMFSLVKYLFRLLPVSIVYVLNIKLKLFFVYLENKFLIILMVWKLFSQSLACFFIFLTLPLEGLASINFDEDQINNFGVYDSCFLCSN